MLAFHSVEYYKKVEKLLNNMEEFFSYFDEVVPREEKKYLLEKILSSRKSENSADYSYAIAKGICEEGELLKYYKNKFETFSSTFSFAEFIKLSSKIELEYSKICDEYSFTDDSIIMFINDLNDLNEIHETLVKNNFQNSHKINFFETVEKVIIEYNILISSIKSYIKSISNMPDNFEIVKNETLNIQLLNVEYNVKEFYEILENIDESYNIIDSVVNNNNSALKIGKIESGSFLAEFFGNEITIGIIIHFLIKIIEYVYRKFTNSGSNDLTGKEIKAIAESVDLMEKIQAAGIEVNDENKEEINQCFNAVVKKLHSIVVKSPKIKINGEIYNVENSQLYLENTQKMLEVQKEETN